MICHKRKIIFIHIPRTAGQSIEHFLFPGHNFTDKKNKRIMYGWDNKSGWLNHLTCNEIKRDNLLPGRTYYEYFKFAFIRNPWERLVSEYVWKFDADNIKFRQFCIDISEGNYSNWAGPYRGPKAFMQHIKPQYEYIFNSKGHSDINFLGRYENLDMDFRQLCERINLAYKKLHRHNKSCHKHYTYYYDKFTEELVRKIYKEDIEVFNYTFGD